MTIFRPDTVRLEGQRLAEYEFQHKKILKQLRDKIKELFDFRRFNIKRYNKLHNIFRIPPSYDSIILKKIKSLIKSLKPNYSSMVFLGSSYIGTSKSYFLKDSLIATSLGIILPLLHPLFPFTSSPLLIGLTSQNPKPEDKPKTERSELPEKSANSKSQIHQNKKCSTIAYMKILFPEIEDIILTGLDGPPVAIYIRVSTWLQVLEGQSMEYQKEQLLKLAKQINASIIYIISDAGKSGRNFSNRNLGIILQLAAAQKIQRLLVSEVDRAGRDAFELLFYLFQLRRYNVLLQTPQELLDLKRLVDLVNLAFKSAAAEDQVLARGAGSKRTKVGNFLKGQWNLPIPLGYRKSSKKSWIKKAPAWTPIKIFDDIFIFYREMKNREAVCRTVNRQYDNFLMSTIKRHLTPAEITRILKNSVYFGKPCYGEAVKEDPNLAFIDDITIFEKAQEIMKKKSQEYERHDKRIQEVAKYFDPDALKCIENIIVPCPKCRKPMDGNGHPGYVCPTCDKNRSDLKKIEIANLRHHVLYREQILKLTIKFSEKHQLNPKARSEVAELERLLEKAITKASMVRAKMKKAKKEVKKN